MTSAFAADRNAVKSHPVPSPKQCLQLPCRRHLLLSVASLGLRRAWRGGITPGSLPSYGGAVSDPRSALRRLQGSARSELASLCDQHRVELLVAFGSTARGEDAPRDLDLGVRFADSDPDVLSFLDSLGRLADTSVIDLLNLAAAGPVAKERALVGSVLLFEQAPGTLARAQIAAMMERMDTDWLRRLDLELMAA
jgi:predicted nucleotidyltransferase